VHHPSGDDRDSVGGLHLRRDEEPSRLCLGVVDVQHESGDEDEGGDEKTENAVHDVPPRQ